MSGNTNSNTVLDVVNIQAHFTSLSAAALAYLQSVISAGSPLVLTANNQNEVPLTIEAYAGQIQPLLQVLDQNSVAGFQVDENCGVLIESQAAAEVPLIVRAAAAQSASLLEVRNSSDSFMLGVAAEGSLTFPGVASNEFAIDIERLVAASDVLGVRIVGGEGALGAGNNAPLMIVSNSYGARQFIVGHTSGVLTIKSNDAPMQIGTSGGSGGPITFKAGNGSDAGKFDDSSTAGHTRFFVYDVDNGQLERVTVGAADSGGAGFKVLRIPN